MPLNEGFKSTIEQGLVKTSTAKKQQMAHLNKKVK